MANGTTIIGPSMQQVIATRYVLYGVDAQGNIQQYQNTPNDWLTVGTFGKQLATDDYDLF